MNTKPNPFVKPIATIATGAIFAGGLLFAGTPAANAETSTTSSQLAAVQQVVGAQFWVRALATAAASANASAVSYNGTTVTAGMLLEEYSTASEHEEVRNLRLPTKREIRKYGIKIPVGTSMAEAEAIVQKEVRQYRKDRRAAQRRVARLEIRIKHASSYMEKRELRLKLKQARQKLATFDTYEEIPIFEGEHGLGYENAGLRNRKERQPYADKVDGSKDIFVYVPAVNEVVVAWKVSMSNVWLEGCHNYVNFEFPPETPDRSLFIVVKDITKIDLQVTVSVWLKILLEMGGSLSCPDGSVKTDWKGQYYENTKSETVTVPGDWDIYKVIRFGEDKVRAKLPVLEAEAHAAVQAAHSKELTDKINLVCDNQKPYIDIVQYFEHLYTDATPDNNRDDGGLGRMKVVIGDPEDSPERILANFSVANNVSTTGPVKVLVNDSEYPVHVAIEGNQVVAYFWLRALALKDPKVAENFTVTVRYTDAAGQEVVVTTAPKPVMPDDF